MPEPLTLLAILAHPDDESLGTGGALARYAAEGVDVHLVTATRGEKGRFFPDQPRPSDEEVGRAREGELLAAARTLGVGTVEVLGYPDGELDDVDPGVILPRLVRRIRALRPHVVLTFDQYGAYGHPDHVAISQFTAAAIVAAADPAFGRDDLQERPHAVSKLYCMAWNAATWHAYQAAFKELAGRVDGATRTATPWPDWSITTRIDTRDYWSTVWRAVQCHQTQIAVYQRLAELSPADHQALWGIQTFYRVFSTVNGGRQPETDLFEGLRQHESDDEHT